MVNMGMHLEEGVKEGRLTREEGSSAKRYGEFAKKKDGEEHDVTSHMKPRRPSVRRKTVRPAINQHQVAHIAPIFRDNQHSNNQQSPQQYQQQHHRPQQQTYRPRNSNQTSASYERKKVTSDPIPMTYAELYPSLIERKLITSRDPPAIPANPQWWYKPELHCVYHSGAPSHGVENCYSLKTKVQDLVRCGILCFEDVGPNVKKNPLPEHGKSVNMVQGCPGKYKNRNVDEDEPEVNVISPVFRMPEPVTIKYDGSKQKNVVAIEDGKDVTLPSSSVVNIADVSGLTRNGRVFSAPPKPQASADFAERPMGNAVNLPNPALVVNPSPVPKLLLLLALAEM
ncbi:hypothetical protein KIW84_031026 [Lathyrus oleraceus]|uniref:Gag-pol polyprotein n=1 Tax=Pisum sativum TaxID=3888 RepID=A0A9D4XR96_PEA|nr:hypothetical protein KIW84_031026 [Pisum sativum]